MLKVGDMVEILPSKPIHPSWNGKRVIVAGSWRGPLYDGMLRCLFIDTDLSWCPSCYLAIHEQSLKLIQTGEAAALEVLGDGYFA